MKFDEFVNALLKEAISSLPQKTEEPPKSMPKSISDITGVSSRLPVPTAPSNSAQPPPTQEPPSPQQGKEREDDSTSSEALKQIADSAKDTKDFFAKLIATLTAQKQQAPTTPAPTNIPPVSIASTNPQNIISNLTKMA